MSYTYLYDFIFDMKSFVTWSTSQRIPRTCTKDSPGTFHACAGCHLGLYAERKVYMSSSQWFNPCHCDLIDLLRSVASGFGRSLLSLSVWWLQPAHGRSTQGHCSIIYQTCRPGWSHLRRGRVRGLLGYLQPWPLRQTDQTSDDPSRDLLVAIWQDQYCVQGRGGCQGPKGRQHLLVYCLVETSAAAEQHAHVWANPCLHLVSWHTPPIPPVAVVAVMEAAKAANHLAEILLQKSIARISLVSTCHLGESP